jgi:hypothetical protein
MMIDVSIKHLIYFNLELSKCLQFEQDVMTSCKVELKMQTLSIHTLTNAIFLTGQPIFSLLQAKD